MNCLSLPRLKKETVLLLFTQNHKMSLNFNDFRALFKPMSPLPIFKLHEVFTNKRMTYPQNLKFQDLTAHL